MITGIWICGQTTIVAHHPAKQNVILLHGGLHEHGDSNKVHAFRECYRSNFFVYNTTLDFVVVVFLLVVNLLEPAGVNATLRNIARKESSTCKSRRDLFVCTQLNSKFAA